jgi:tetratricopeptide (TPR) repeat protein
MKLRVLVIIAVMAVSAREPVFAKGIAEERAANDYEALYENVLAYLGEGKFAYTIPLLERMHQLKPQEIEVVEALGVFYMLLSEERPEFKNAFYWLAESEKRGSSSNMVYYYLACIYSLEDEVEKSVTEMNKAVALGYSNFDWMSLHDDLENFRTSSWWEEIEDSYSWIGQLLSQFYEYISNEDEKSDIDRITFYGGIVIALKTLAPHIPALQSFPLFYLGSSYEDIEDYARAEQNYLEVKNILGTVLGENHPDYARVLIKLDELQGER